MSKRTTAIAATKPAGLAAATPPIHYDEAFQCQAVELWLRTDQPGTQIAHELGLRYDRLKAWKRRHHGAQPPIRAELAAANRALKAELARVCEQRDILKKRWASSPKRRAALPAHRNHEKRALCGPTLRRPGRVPLRLPRLAARRPQRPRPDRCRLDG
jgi:transposase-like protein